MSSKNYKNYERTTRGIPYVRRINLSNNNRRTRRKLPKLCPDCKATSECIKLISNKVNKIEEIVDNFYKNLLEKENKRFSEFNADLSNFTLENLQKLVIFTTQNRKSNII